jgi:hypothetical protein
VLTSRFYVSFISCFRFFCFCMSYVHVTHLHDSACLQVSYKAPHMELFLFIWNTILEVQNSGITDSINSSAVLTHSE